MKYNEKYKIYVSKEGLCFRLKNDKLELIPISHNNGGYACNSKGFIHRIVWETFNGEIPKGFQIDHINTIRNDNRLINLRCVTTSENLNNPITLKRNIDSHKWQKPGLYRKNKSFSYFGEKYIEHYGYSKSENRKQYDKEIYYFKKNNHFSWEK